MIFTIIIPIHNRLPITQQGLLSLYNALGYYESNGSPTCKFQVVVIDDGSTDGSSAWISENYPSIHILKGNGDLWWTGSINLGARFAVETIKSQYVILWNDDTTCGIDYFYQLEKVLMLGEEYRSSILACKVLWLDKPDTLFNFGCFYNARTGKKKLIGYNGKDADFQDIIPIDWSGGMGTVIPSEILVAIDYFDSENFPQYHGDSDFFLRAKSKGYKAFAIPALKIWNNRETTGIKVTRSFSDLSKALYSNRSNYNLKQNYVFNQRHSNNIASWAMLLYGYAIFIGKSFKKIVWSLGN